MTGSAEDRTVLIELKHKANNYDNEAAGLRILSSFAYP